ncbi:MAG: phenylacetate-CoA oxygenase subunit PaaC [bacterium]|nr:phenylacetate-CoA oxygenase subunit PaaC [Acidimicrobiia bacterium]MCY4649552.1 phenylacetate-CoA oxygenase subunit PaaC [bacterium]
MAVTETSGLLTENPSAPRDSALFRYVLYQADDNLVLAQRMSAWISRAHDLEEDIALANIALDLLGRARMLLEYAGKLEGKCRTEDELAMFRSEREYTNLLLVEQPNGDFAYTMVRQFFFDAYQLGLWKALADSKDTTLAAIAGKALKEARYHLRHSSGWLVRLGDGTRESHRRTRQAVEELWRFVPEMFESEETCDRLAEAEVAVSPSQLRPAWIRRVRDTFSSAGLQIPGDRFSRSGGRSGFHTEHLGYLLAEMQWMQRSYPGMQW